MNQFQVDPDALTEGASVASRQAGHISAIRSYVNGACNRPDAFKGATSIFSGPYAETISNASEGLDHGVEVSDKVRSSFDGSRESYLASDQRSHAGSQKLIGDLGSRSPYRAPGGGDGEVLPGGTPPGAAGRVAAVYDDSSMPQPFGDGAMNAAVDTATLNPRLQPHNLGFLDPKGALVDHVTSPIKDRIQDATYEHYRDYHGLSGEDAGRLSHGHSQVGGALGTVKGLYDGVSNIQHDVVGIENAGTDINDTTGDISDYNAYDSQPVDDTIEHWAGTS